MGELAELFQRPFDVAAELLEQVSDLGRLRACQLASEAQVRAQCHELLLRPVVQVALDTTPLGVRSRHHARPLRPQLLGLAPDLVERRLELRVETHVAEGEPDLAGELG